MEKSIVILKGIAGLILYEVFRKGTSLYAIKSRADSPAATIARTGVFSVYATFSLV